MTMRDVVMYYQLYGAKRERTRWARIVKARGGTHGSNLAPVTNGSDALGTFLAIASSLFLSFSVRRHAPNPRGCESNVSGMMAIYVFFF